MERVNFQAINLAIGLIGWYPFGSRPSFCQGRNKDQLKYYQQKNQLPQACNNCYKILFFWQDNYNKENLSNFFSMFNSLPEQLPGKLNQSLAILYTNQTDLKPLLSELEQKIISFNVKCQLDWRRACKKYQDISPHLWQDDKTFLPI